MSRNTSPIEHAIVIWLSCLLGVALGYALRARQPETSMQAGARPPDEGSAA